jgi:hypothetical protein
VLLAVRSDEAELCIQSVSLVPGGKEQPLRIGKVGAGIGPVVEIRKPQCVLQFLGCWRLGLRRQSRYKRDRKQEKSYRKWRAHCSSI